jgi:uncharacterized protein DUF4136
MKKPSLIIQLVAVMIGFISCGPSLQVTSDYDKSVDFQQYKTFALYKAEKLSNASISQLNQERIFNSIRNEMQKKGFTETGINPDLLLNPVAIIKDKVSVSPGTDYYGYGGVYRPYGPGYSFSATSYNIQHYKDGSLIIDLIDAASKKLVWQGIGNSEIDKPIKDPETQIPKAVQMIMADFPPGMNKKSK